MIEIENIDCFNKSTGIAARELNRFFLGYEIDPYYFSIAKNRIFDII